MEPLVAGAVRAALAARTRSTAVAAAVTEKLQEEAELLLQGHGKEKEKIAKELKKMKKRIVEEKKKHEVAAVAVHAVSGGGKGR